MQGRGRQIPWQSNLRHGREKCLDRRHVRCHVCRPQGHGLVGSKRKWMVLTLPIMEVRPTPWMMLT